MKRRGFIGSIFGGVAAGAAIAAAPIVKPLLGEQIRRVNGRWQRGDKLVAVSEALDELGLEGFSRAIEIERQAERDYINAACRRFLENDKS